MPSAKPQRIERVDNNPAAIIALVARVCILGSMNSSGRTGFAYNAEEWMS